MQLTWLAAAAGLGLLTVALCVRPLNAMLAELATQRRMRKSRERQSRQARRRRFH